MQKHHYETAVEALAALKMYSDYYASSEPYQQRFQEIVAMLKHKALTAPTNSRARKFLEGLSQALQSENG